MRNPRLNFCRRPRSVVWHFRRECKQYPRPDQPYIFKAKRPKDGRALCQKCLAIEARPSTDGFKPD